METLIIACFAALFGACWIAELRINSKLRDYYREEGYRKHQEHALRVEGARNTGWEEGRQYELARRAHQHPRNRGQFIERTK